MKEVAKKQFRSEIVKEYFSKSYTRKMEWSENEMTLYMSDDNQKGFIEWCIDYDDGDNDVVEIGLWFDTEKNLTDYDGVFSLSNKAIEFLEEQGYNCDYAKD